MHDERAFTRDEEAVGFPSSFLLPLATFFLHRPPLVSKDGHVFLFHLRLKPFQREIGTEYGNGTSLLVVNGMEIGHKRKGCIVHLKERFRPETFFCFQPLQEPVLLEIIPLFDTQVKNFYRATVASHGIGHVTTTFLRVVVLNEADATAADTGILFDNALRQFHQVVWPIEILFNFGHMVYRSHVNIGEHAADIFSRSLKHRLVAHFLIPEDERATQYEY